jgi:D-alanine-D-alanine ligase
MRVLVVTGDHALPDRTKWDGGYSPSDLELHAEMRAALGSLDGYEFEFLTEHARLLDRLLRDPPDLVLNFCDAGFRNLAAQELHVPALLELVDVPYTGAGPACMVLCYDKAVTRLVAAASGIPVPDEIYLSPDRSPTAVDFPLPALLKPVHGDGSLGITRDSVVCTREQARSRLERFARELAGSALLAQEFLTGPEYGLALVGNPRTGFTAFPPLEVDYSALPADLPPILAFESKTGPETPYGRVSIRPASLPPATVAELRRRAELLFARLQCRDYARFDFRTDADGTIKLLEVNPNPAWSSAGKLAIMAGFAGRSYAELLGMILGAARARLALSDD